MLERSRSGLNRIVPLALGATVLAFGWDLPSMLRSKISATALPICMGLHNAAAMATVAFCGDEHPKLLNDARLPQPSCAAGMTTRNRHDRIAEADLRRLFIATTKVYNGLRK